MAGRGWRIGVGLLVLPAAVAGLAGCSGGSGGSGGSAHPAASASKTSSTAKAANVEAYSAATLKGALLTRVNGVPAAAASSGKYASVSQASAGAQAAPGAQVTPKACTGPATEGFDPAALVGAPAAAVTFRVGTNGVSEVLVAPSAKSAASALAWHVPAGCARYKEKAGGKTFTYEVTEQPVTGIGEQAKVLNAQATSASPDDLWSLIYRGSDFVGMVTVVGPNASEKAVQELGQQAYAYAAKTLS